MSDIRVRSRGERVSASHCRALIRTLWDHYSARDYAAILAGLPIIESAGCGVASTNGRDIHISPDGAARYSDPELLFILIHEAAHCAANHSGRFSALLTRLGEDTPLTHDTFNVAADYTINDALVTLCRSVGPIISPPDDGMYPPDEYKGLSAEEIYRRMVGKTPPGDDEPGDDEAGDDEPGDDEAGDDEPGAKAPVWGRIEPNAELEDPIQAADLLQRAIQVSKIYCGSGSTPVLTEMLRGILCPRVDWRGMLREYLTGRQGSPSYYRPSRRGAGSEFILPGRDHGMLRAFVAIDTSGSMAQRELSRIVSDLNDLTSDLACDITLVQCDTTIRFEAEYAHGEEIPRSMMLHGGGGTAFSQAFAKARECGAEIVLYFTDLCGEYVAADDPQCPVIWICPERWRGNVRMLFGEIVYR